MMAQAETPSLIGSLGFVVAAVLMVIGALLMPHASQPTTNLQTMLIPLGQQKHRTILASLLMLTGFWAAMVGVASLTATLTSGEAAIWSRLSFSFVLVGTTLWTISLSLDIASAHTVARWLNTPREEKETAFQMVAMLAAVGQGLFPPTWIVYWLAVCFLGITMVLSSMYPAWLGGVGLLLAAFVIPLGILQIFKTRSLRLTLMFGVLLMVTAVWFFLIGIWIAYAAW